MTPPLYLNMELPFYRQNWWSPYLRKFRFMWYWNFFVSFQYKNACSISCRISAHTASSAPEPINTHTQRWLFTDTVHYHMTRFCFWKMEDSFSDKIWNCTIIHTLLIAYVLKSFCGKQIIFCFLRRTVIGLLLIFLRHFLDLLAKSSVILLAYSALHAFLFRCLYSNEPLQHQPQCADFSRCAAYHRDS